MSSGTIGQPQRLDAAVQAAGLARAQAPAAQLRAGAEVDDAALRRVAQEFEAAFLTEMLKHTGLESAGQTFGGSFTGGHGARAFKSFLIREYADGLSEQNALGLAEQIYADLKRKVSPHAE